MKMRKIGLCVTSVLLLARWVKIPILGYWVNLPEPCQLRINAPHSNHLQNWLVRVNYSKTIISLECALSIVFLQIYPSFEDVASSHDGLLAGGCLPYSKSVHEKQTWLNHHLW